MTSSPQNEWRSPTGGATLSFADEQYSPSRKENATRGAIFFPEPTAGSVWGRETRAE